MPTRAVDPDLYGTAFIFPSGSGSRRKKIKNNRKSARKLVTKVNLDQHHGFFYTFEPSFCVFLLQKALHKLIFKAGSGT